MKETDIETMKKTQSEMKYTLTEVNNNLQGINSRVDKVENQISDLKYKEAKTKKQNQTTQSVEQKEKKNPKNWEQKNENLFEKIMTENFPNLVNEIATKSRKHRESQQDEPKETHTKTKKKILKAER